VLPRQSSATRAVEWRTQAKRTTAVKRIILAFCLLHAATAAYADSLKDAKWNALIAEAVKRGGVETISGNTGSYVFSGLDRMDMTVTRSLDNKIRLICMGYMSKNINVCMNWDNEKMIYSTRANETAPWVTSSTPPTEAAQDQDTRSYLSRLFGTGGGVQNFARWWWDHAFAVYGGGRIR
jgi:hypothetical protein